MDKKNKKDENIDIPETEETVETEQAEIEQEVIDPAKEQIEALEKELAEMKDRYLRVAAEYENYRRRSAKERESFYQDATAAAISAMLPVLDNLERAAAQPTEDEAFMKGVELTLKQFGECLEKLGVKEIPALGEQFDPNLHNAVMHVEQEGCDDNTIVEVFQKGFIMGDRVVRHAIVKVAN